MENKQAISGVVILVGSVVYTWIMYDYGVPWEIAVVNYVLLWAIAFYVVFAEMA